MVLSLCCGAHPWGRTVWIGEVPNLPVIENPVVLVAPESNELVWVSEMCGGDLLDSVDHFGEVPQVEHVVTLGRSGQESVQYTLRQTNNRNFFTTITYDSVKFFWTSVTYFVK